MGSKAGKKRMARSRAMLQRDRAQREAAMAAPRYPMVVDTDAQSSLSAGLGSPPPEVVDLYVDVFQWAHENPDLAAEMDALTEHDIANWVAGIAYAEKFGFQDWDCIEHARQIQYWAVLKGIVYLFEWPKAIAQMSAPEVVAAIHADRLAGKIPESVAD